MNTRLGRLAALFALVTCAVMLLAPLARAEWLPPVDISETGEHAGVPSVALDSEGNATAVWDRWDGTATEVETAFRPAGASWGEPEVLSPPDSQSAQVVVDRNGVLTAAWERRTGVNMVAIESVSRMPGQSWTAPVEVSEFAQGASPEPWLAVDWEGNNTIVWKQGEIVMSSFRTFLASWGEPIPLSEGESFVPQAAMDARGDATAVWMHHDGSDYVVESAYRPEQGEWESPTLVSQPGEEGGNPQVAIDGNGDSLVVWRGEDEGVEFVRASYRPAEGVWSEPVDVSAAGEEVESLQAAVDPEGNAIVAWSGNLGEAGEHDTVRAAYRPAGGTWEAPVDLSDEGGNGFPSDVVFDQSGNAAIVWERWDGVTNLVQAAYRPAGGEWEEPIDLSEEGKQGMDAVVVLDAPGSAEVADGDATAVWISAAPIECPSEKEEGPCHSYVVQAAGYDPDGLPEIEIEAPAEGKVDEQIKVSTPTEGLFSPQIEFGDGAEVAAIGASHVYDEPGTYLLKVAGAEELGYRSVTAQSITIREKPMEPGGGKEKPKPKPDPEPEAEPGDGGSAQGGGTKAADPPAPPVTTSPPPGPSQGCLTAMAARDAAAARLRRVRSKLELAANTQAKRRLVTAMHKRQAALRRARARASAAC
ncbi:MAG TPA: hypothetical protein VHP56_08250 [Solirubrobacterales bacterium]|jgi:hypothetical protein|nr:hypothetical protein [Solirubrobacterales bacterium]